MAVLAALLRGDGRGSWEVLLMPSPEERRAGRCGAASADLGVALVLTASPRGETTAGRLPAAVFDLILDGSRAEHARTGKATFC